MTDEEIIAFVMQYCSRGRWFRVRKTLDFLESNKLQIVKLTRNCQSDSMLERVYWMLNSMTEYPNCCEVCGTKIKAFISLEKGYHVGACSIKCGVNSDRHKDNKKKTMLEKYGVEHQWQSKEVREKIKDTCKMRYNTGNGWGSEHTKSKFRKTCLERYGVEHHLSASLIREKIKMTSIDNFGVEHHMMSQEVKDKIKDTSMTKYGVESALSSPIVRDKIKQTNRQRYGHESIGSVPEFIDSRIKNRLSNVYERKCDEASDYEPLFSVEEFNGCKSFKKWRHTVCGKEFDDHMRNGSLPKCSHCFPKLFKTSIAEQEIYEFVKLHAPTAINGVRTVITPQELDIYIPELNLAFEYDGLYWHSFDRIETAEERKYHNNKTRRCAELGIRLIHIFENEWLHKREIVESRILHILGKSRTIFARKCKIVELNGSNAAAFMRNNHIQGTCAATTKLGLEYKGELVAVMTFGKPRFSKDADVELLRYANTIGVSVVGGASKLFKHFLKKNSGLSIISYSDRRWNTGELYSNLGFKFVENTTPSFYYANTDTMELHHRSKFMKHKLPGILGERFDPAKTESQNMFDAGYRRIWDCGTSKWLFTSS